MAAQAPSIELLESACAGNVAALARLISRVESSADDIVPVLAQAYRRAGRAHIVGITGVPGGGKSTLVSRLVQSMRRLGGRVAVLAIDPSSPFSGGSLLGDRLRMVEHAMDEGVFVRSMATRGATGGLAHAALGAVDVMDACGYATILVETVGVGQDEIDIAHAVHTTVVVSPPGLGDDIQAIKAGLMEVADVHVVSKFDRPDAQQALAELHALLAYGADLRDSNAWQVPVIATSAEKGQGIEELMKAVSAHHQALVAGGLYGQRLRRIARYRTLKNAEQLLRRRFNTETHHGLDEAIERIVRRELDPYTAAELFLNVE